jgi:F-type H+-transporting ATPase subunit a
VRNAAQGQATRALQAKPMMDPIHQFEIHDLLPLFKVGAREIGVTNSAIYMMVSVVLTVVFLLGATSGRRLVPTRMQSLANDLRVCRQHG